MCDEELCRNNGARLARNEFLDLAFESLQKEIKTFLKVCEDVVKAIKEE